MHFVMTNIRNRTICIDYTGIEGEITMETNEEERKYWAAVSWMVRMFEGVTREVGSVRQLPREKVFATMAFQNMTWNGTRWADVEQEAERDRIIRKYGHAAYYDQTPWQMDGE